MIETFLVLGCIVFFILLAISFQERSIMYKDYPTSCDVTYIPEKETIYMGPSNFKTRGARKLELENFSINELKAQIFEAEYTEGTIEDIYSTGYGDSDDMGNDQLIEIILDIEYDSFKNENISPGNSESDNIL